MNSFLNNVKCVIFDLDGTIYFGTELAEKADEVIMKVRKEVENIFFVTNNSAKSRFQIYEKLLNLNINVNFNEVINSGYLIAKYLYENSYKDVYCLGTDSLSKEIEDMGVNSKSNNPQAIVLGYDINFKITQLEHILKIFQKNCKIIVANKERVYPRHNGILTPGTGAIAAALEYTLNKSTDIVIGKPSPLMLDLIVKNINILPNEIMMIGDSYESDVIMAEKFGAKAVLISEKEFKTNNFKVIKKLKDILELF
ncbi:MAG: HAD-IIA family hydrolase [Endomicrobiaceae bacterium]|nr:HAD-IIA family hydrolase [Endomicrobiaceae bacterium]